MEIGEYIAELRKKQNLSQRRLAELSGISNTEISRIESGERQKVSPDILTAIAPILGVKRDTLMVVAGYFEKSYSFKYDELPDVFKPFWKPDSELIFGCVEDINGSTIEERKKAIEEFFSTTNALDYQSELKSLLDLLPEDKKGKPISLYDLYTILGNDEVAMQRLKVLDEMNTIQDKITNLEIGLDFHNDAWVSKKKELECHKEKLYLLKKAMDEPVDVGVDTFLEMKSESASVTRIIDILKAELKEHDLKISLIESDLDRLKAMKCELEKVHIEKKSEKSNMAEEIQKVDPELFTQLYRAKDLPESERQKIKEYAAFILEKHLNSENK